MIENPVQVVAKLHNDNFKFDIRYSCGIYSLHLVVVIFVFFTARIVHDVSEFTYCSTSGEYILGGGGGDTH